MQERHEAQQRQAGGAAQQQAAPGGEQQHGEPPEPQPEASTSGRGADGAAAAQSWRQRGAGGRGSLKVVANLPYNITKDFLKATLPLGGTVAELSIMIQHEVAERLVDPTPGRPDYRAMSIYTHYYSSPKYRRALAGGGGCTELRAVVVCLCAPEAWAASSASPPPRALATCRLRIPRQKYFPVPGVDGALVTFRLAPPSKRLEVPSERSFHALVTKAFSERRKMMRNSMQPLFSSQQVGRGGAREGCVCAALTGVGSEMPGDAPVSGGSRRAGQGRVALQHFFQHPCL